MTDLEQLAPELFAIARQLRDRGATVKIRNIRTGVDEQGDGGTVVAGTMPEFDLPDARQPVRRPVILPLDPYRNKR